MEVVILDSAAAVAIEAAARVRQLLEARPAAVLGLATGETPRKLYRELVGMHREQGLSFRNATTFNLDEYLDLDPGDPRSYRQYMQRELFDHVDVDPAKTHLPTCLAGEDPAAVSAAYERRIGDAGGIDLQLLGIGRNGHIAFNEPTSSLASRTRVKTLTRDTLAANRSSAKDRHPPGLAITMGIGTILEARSLLLLATGDGKADALRQAIEGPVSARCPASALQLHPRATVLADTAAAGHLELRDYYEWTAAEQSRLLAERA